MHHYISSDVSLNLYFSYYIMAKKDRKRIVFYMNCLGPKHSGNTDV